MPIDQHSSQTFGNLSDPGRVILSAAKNLSATRPRFPASIGKIH